MPGTALTIVTPHSGNRYTRALVIHALCQPPAMSGNTPQLGFAGYADAGVGGMRYSFKLIITMLKRIGF